MTNTTNIHSSFVLINYLNEHFYNKTELLQKAKIKQTQFTKFTELGIMPLCSYRLEMNINCHSFFGQHQPSEDIEYFSKGYLNWLKMLQSMASPQQAQTIFGADYKQQISLLLQQGFICNDEKFTHGLEQHITQEWQHFLQGIYGLCTKSGLVPDIAKKALATEIIKQLLNQIPLNASQKTQLNQAIDLLDQASSVFAPHELALSSRQTLITDLRMRFNLASDL